MFFSFKFLVDFFILFLTFYGWNALRETNNCLYHRLFFRLVRTLLQNLNLKSLTQEGWLRAFKSLCINECRVNSNTLRKLPNPQRLYLFDAWLVWKSNTGTGTLCGPKPISWFFMMFISAKEIQGKKQQKTECLFIGRSVLSRFKSFYVRRGLPRRIACLSFADWSAVAKPNANQISATMFLHLIFPKDQIVRFGCTMWVASPWGFSVKTIQPVRHECHACCLLRAGFLAFQPVVDNTRCTRVEQAVSSFQKILRGLQLTW